MVRVGRHAFSVVLLVVVTIGFLCLFNGSRRIGKPFPGFLLSEGRIVVSIGRSAWIGAKWERVLWAQVVAVEGKPVASAAQVDAAIAHHLPGTPVNYRFYKRSEVFNLPIEVRHFSFSDFSRLYATYFAVGLCFALAGWYPTRRPRPWPAATVPFFVFCQIVALVLFLGGDVYGPHWFTALYFLCHCLLPAALWHLTLTYPENLLSDWLRRASLVSFYIPVVAWAWLINSAWDDPSWLLPLIYTTYLVLANTILLHFGRVAIAWRTSEGSVRQSLRRSLIGIILSASIPLVLFVFYPAMDRTIPPLLLVGPLLFFPVLTAAGMGRLAPLSARNFSTSVHRRLSLLFLGAVETAYVAGVGVFWMSSTWEQVTAELQWGSHQRRLVAELGNATMIPEEALETIEGTAQTNEETVLLGTLRQAINRGNQDGQAAALASLRALYEERERLVAQRLDALGTLDEAFFVLLVLVGTAQAVVFMLAVRRWLMAPVAQLATATAVIATGDLSHRVTVSSSEEFTALGNAINAMAESLASIQARIESEREARHLAAASARDAERRRLGHELHDGVLQDLSAIKLSLESLQRGTPAAADLAAPVDALIGVIVGLRRVIDDIAAPDLAQDSLARAIASYSQMATLGQDITLDLDLDNRPLVAEWATRDVYRIAQEAVTNAVRHSTPSKLRISLSSDGGGKTLLEVEDNGSGFVDTTATLGTGLPGMRERAAAIGAQLTIQPKPGSGTLVRLRLPTTPNAPNPSTRSRANAA